MNKNFFLLLFILGFYPQFSFATDLESGQLTSEELPKAIAIEINSSERSDSPTLVDALEINSKSIELGSTISLSTPAMVMSPTLVPQNSVFIKI